MKFKNLTNTNSNLEKQEVKTPIVLEIQKSSTIKNAYEILLEKSTIEIMNLENALNKALNL